MTAAALCLGLRLPSNFFFADFLTRSLFLRPVLGVCGLVLTADLALLRVYRLGFRSAVLEVLVEI